MDKRLTTHFEHRHHPARQALIGLTVIGIGALALLDNLQLFDTALLRNFWPLALVLWGVARLVWPRHHGSRVAGLMLVIVGSLLTAHHLGFHPFEFRQWWPVLVIVAGVAIALRGFFPGSRWDRTRFESSTIEHEDEVQVDATFSGIKLQNDSRSFKGGRIAINFGGLELDLREAQMAGTEATIEISANFSGVELRVPRDWQVVVQVSATMGAVEDKTTPPAVPGHRLVLRGETVFGGVEIKN